ncbi:hypothetical protein F4604DRAFT_1688905 [Suillus subluteus]|nr:hypothetical protein F4604DRAFT_1688905 [Suillus subluteus]
MGRAPRYGPSKKRCSKALKDQLKHARTCLRNKENIPLPQGTTLLRKLPQQVEVLKRQLAASNDKLVCTQDQLYQVREAHATTYTKAKHYQKVLGYERKKVKRTKVALVKALQDAARWKGTVKDKSDELTRAHADLEEKTTQLLTLRCKLQEEACKMGQVAEKSKAECSRLAEELSGCRRNVLALRKRCQRNAARAIKAALSRNKQHAKNASVAKYFSALDIVVDDALLNAMLDQPIKDQLELHRRLGEEKTIPKKSHLSSKHVRLQVLLLVVERYEARRRGESLDNEVNFLDLINS